jgi:geranylgeranyl diphosphate synthase type I
VGEVRSLANPALNIEASRGETLPSIFRRYRSDIGIALRKSLATDHLPVYQMLRYSMGWSSIHGNSSVITVGKALRPTLCLFACEATGGPASKALPAAVSLELIHNFSLIHDDIQDRDETRRHRPTLWAVWGEPKALVAGNTLRAIADISLWRLLDEDITFERAVTVVGLLTQAYLEMIEGQYLDLSFEGRPDVGLREYLGMISKKTGALIRCALNLGALIGSGDADTVRAFRECGRSLGYVFQIRDDMLGIWGDEQTTGKPVGADIRRKKNTLPVVYAMSQARGSDKELLESIYRKRSVGDEEVASVLDVLSKVKARDYAQSLASEHREKAIEALSGLELDPQTLQDMEGIARFLQLRQR